MRALRDTPRWKAAALFAVLLWTGCAYFNTLYNAKEKYREAEKATLRTQQSQTPGVSTPGPNPQAAAYEDVIEKCKKLMERYPDSRHVDDAMLLSAMCLYRLNRFDEAAAAVDSMEQRHPKSELLDDAQFIKGKSLVGAKKYDLAVPVLRDFINHYRGNDNRPEALYLLITSLMQLDLSQDAVAALRVLEKDHGRSEYRFRAQVDAAKILADKQLYQESLNVYQRLSDSRIPENVRFDVLTGMARVQEQLGDYQAALATLGQIQKAPPGIDKEPTLILLRAKGYAGIDSTQRAIYAYQDVTKRFARGTYAAEAYFNLGELYEAMDSLVAAQRSYDEVPRAYSGSEHANEAIKRSGNISRVLKLQATSGDDSPEAVALRTFSMAEIQLFQFSNAPKAAESYQKIVTDFPESEYAPRAVYALGYISGVVQGDTAKAREWYDVLRTKYPDSEQTKLAIAFYKGAIPPPPYSEMMKTATVLKPSAPTRGRPEPPRRQPPKPTPIDSTRTAPPPVVGAPPPGPAATPASTAPKDTTAAPGDSTRGSN